MPSFAAMVLQGGFSELDYKPREICVDGNVELREEALVFVA